MNATGVFISAGRRLGILVTLMGLTTGGLLAQKIYVLSDWRGVRVTTYTADGAPSTPNIDLGLMCQCTGIAVSGSGDIYISNITEVIAMRIFGPDGTFKSKTFLPGIISMTSDADRLYLLGQNQAMKAAPRLFGYDMKRISTFGTDINDAVSAKMAVSNGDLYLLADGGTVSIYSADGKLKKRFGTRGQHAIGVAKDGTILIGAFVRVIAFSPDGTKLPMTLSRRNLNGGLDVVNSIATDADGRIYVGYTEALVIYDSNGREITTVKTPHGIKAVAVR